MKNLGVKWMFIFLFVAPLMRTVQRCKYAVPMFVIGALCMITMKLWWSFYFMKPRIYWIVFSNDLFLITFLFSDFQSYWSLAKGVKVNKPQYIGLFYSYERKVEKT